MTKEEAIEQVRAETEDRVKDFRGKVPDSLLDALVSCAVTGQHPGSFLQSVLENDLQGAVARADDELLPEDNPFRQLMVCLFNRLPSGCHGSEERFESWHDSGGLAGLALAEEEP